MAKRNSAGPFAAGPMVQGTLNGATTTDILSFSRGNQISRNFYEHIDPYQGSLVLWITPEWNSNDGKIHTVISKMP
jgi:hypothetical protein